MEEDLGADSARPAQFVRVYQFRKKVDPPKLIGKPVAAGQLRLIKETDNTALGPAAFNPNTFEFQYQNADGTALDLHLDEKRRFASGQIPFMKVGKADRTDIDPAKDAQHVETWQVTVAEKGPVDFLGQRATVDLVKSVDRAGRPAMKGKFNPNTWEKNYFLDSDFDGKTLKTTAKRLDVHRDVDGSFRKGHVQFMEKAPPLLAPKEQTAIELQSEHGGFLEFETPKWFRDWSELKARIQDAVDMTKAFNDQPGLDPAEKAVKAIDEKKTSATLGKIVHWPDAFSPDHLKNLRAGKRELLVQIVDADWKADIQSSESIALSQYESLSKEHEPPDYALAAQKGGDIFSAAFAAAKLKDPSLDESRFASLKGFFQLIATYIVRGQTLDLTGEVVKAGFRLMARTNFGSMHNTLLTAEERALFKTMVGAPTKPSDNPILTALEPLITTIRGESVTLTRKTHFFFKKAGSDPKKATSGPVIYNWLVGITKGTDLLSGGGFSGAMGTRSVSTVPGDKDYRRALFEVRGTVSHGGRTKPAEPTLTMPQGWVSYAKEIFDAAEERSADVPDDPTTPKVNEASKTVLKK